MKTKLNLEAVTNVVILIAAVVLIGTLAKMWLAPAKPAPAPAVRYVKGDTVPELPKAIATAYEGSDKALLVYVNSNCQYCSASMEFYAKLQAAAKAGAKVPVVFVSRESVETTRRYLASHGLTSATAAELNSATAPKLQLTPTILLVSSTGAVLEQWTGKQFSDGETALLKVVAGQGQ